MKIETSPKVSVIIPTYNRPQLIQRTVQSALDQTYSNIEIIVVDGDPTGATSKKLEAFAGERVRSVKDFVFAQLPPTGTVQDRSNIARNRNAGIRIATGTYIAILDDDDIWLDREKIAKQVRFFEEHPEYSLCGGGVIGLYRESGGKTIEVKELFPEKDEDIRNIMLTARGLVHSTIMYKKSDWERIGGYNEINTIREDWDLHLRLGKIGKMYNFPNYFACFFVGEHEKDHISIYGHYITAHSLDILMRYRKDYPGFYKAFCNHMLHYLYGFIPARLRMGFRPIAQRIQRAIAKILGISSHEQVIKG